jgi:predicted ArsR family transcriptional regulator
MADQRTRRGRVNATGGLHQWATTDLVSDPDVQTIIEYLDTEAPRSIDEIAGKCRLPRAYLQALLSSLATADRIEYTENFQQVWLAGGEGR